MRLRIAGINHNDILGPQRLFAWYEELKSVEYQSPSFVAVEYDELLFRQIKMQRPTMRRLVTERWPDTNDEILLILENSLVYEGDLHEQVFLGVDTLWLDKGRIITDPTVISEYARDRLLIYESFISSTSTKLNMDDIISMCKAAWDHGAAPQRGGSQRDDQFSRAILDKIATARSGWAIVIVGSCHCAMVDGSMVRLLMDQGIQCEVRELRP